MNLETSDVQELIDSIAEVFVARQAELDLSADAENASSDLVAAQEVTTTKFNDFKALVAAKIQTAGLTILQEGDASRSTDPTVTMPFSIGCTC